MMEDVQLRREVMHTSTMTDHHLSSSPVPQDMIEGLIHRSLEAKQNAYCPYSKFRVGAALLTQDDTVFTGKSIILSKVLNSMTD